MIFIALLAALAVIGLVTTAIDVYRDGYRAVATDWTRVAERGPDRDALRDAESALGYR